MATASFGMGPFSVSGYDPVMSFVEGSVNGYFDKKSEKRAFQRQLQLMEAQYSYAKRYAENSPSWNVLGLRNAGLNPILAVSNGANLGATIPSAPSVTSHKPTASNSQGGFRYDPLTSSQLKVNDATIDNLNAQAESVMINSMSQSKEREANTAVKLLEAQKIKQDLKGGGYKNPIVNDVMRGMNETAEALKNNPSNSPNSKDSRSAYIEAAPDSPNYSKDSFLGGIQASIDANNEVSRITGKSPYEVSKMSDSEKTKILKNAHKQKFKSKGYHIFTR